MRKIDIVGETYGKLLVISDAEPIRSNNRNIHRVKVNCSCGTFKIVNVQALRRGLTTSCGCVRKQMTGDRTRTHGGTGTKLYRVWKNMRDRCNNPNGNNFKYYMGRGIRITPDWDDFEVFKTWALTNGYKETLTIDRINNDGNYEPDNCRWATRADQANNRNKKGFYI